MLAFVASASCIACIAAINTNATWSINTTNIAFVLSAALLLVVPLISGALKRHGQKWLSRLATLLILILICVNVAQSALTLLQDRQSKFDPNRDHNHKIVIAQKLLTDRSAHASQITSKYGIKSAEAQTARTLEKIARDELSQLGASREVSIQTATGIDHANLIPVALAIALESIAALLGHVAGSIWPIRTAVERPRHKPRRRQNSRPRLGKQPQSASLGAIASIVPIRKQ